MITPPSEEQVELLIKERFNKYKEGKHSKSGKLFENEIRQSLLEIGEGWYYRPFDAKSFYSLAPQLQAPKQPCDAIFLYHGNLYAFECKSYRQSAFSYPLKELVPEHQIESLTAIENNGGHAFFLFSNRHKRNHYTCYAVKPGIVSQMKDFLEKNGLRSMLWSELKDNGISLDRIKKKMGVYGYGICGG